jgi:hypothetical protein
VCGDFNKLVHEREEITAGSAESNVFCLHGRKQRDLRLHFARPDDRAVGKCDDMPSSTADAVGIIAVFVFPEPSKVCIGVAIEMKSIRRVDAKVPFHDALLEQKYIARTGARQRRDLDVNERSNREASQQHWYSLWFR